MYEKNLMSAITQTGDIPNKAYMEYHGKFEHNIGRIQRIITLIRIDICYIEFRLGNQTMALTISGSQPPPPPYNYYHRPNFITIT